MQEEEGQKQQGPQGQLFHIAFAERRKMNLEKLKQHMAARGLSQSERTRIFKLLQGLWFEKVGPAWGSWICTIHWSASCGKSRRSGCCPSRTTAPPNSRSGT